MPTFYTLPSLPQTKQNSRFCCPTGLLTSPGVFSDMSWVLFMPQERSAGSTRWRWFGQQVTKMHVWFAGNFAKFWQPENSSTKGRNGSRKNLSWGWCGQARWSNHVFLYQILLRYIDMHSWVGTGQILLHFQNLSFWWLMPDIYQKNVYLV